MFSHSLASPVAIMVAGERTAVYPPENVARVLPGRTLVAHCWSCYSQWDCKRKSSYTYAQQNHYLQLCIQTLRNTYCCGIVDGWEYEWASRWPEGIWTDPPYPGEICESGTLDRWIKKKYHSNYFRIFCESLMQSMTIAIFSLDMIQYVLLL